MTLADYALAAIALLSGAYATARDPQVTRLDRTPAAACDAAACPPAGLTPSATHRDEMIRLGLYG
jgi:hypothetical protein